MISLLKKSFNDFRVMYKQLLVFEFLFMLITSSILIPLLTFIFNRILTVIGSGSLLNSEVYEFNDNFEHIIALFIIGVICSYAIFVELCVLLLMVQQRYFGYSITITDAFLTTLKKSPRLFSFGFVQFMFFLLVLIPFVDSPISKKFYSLFNFSILFQKQVIDASITMSIFYIIIVIISLYTFLRLVFVLHFMMLEGMSLIEAIRSSQHLTRHRRFKLFLTLLLLNGLFIGGSFFLFNAISYLPVWLNIDVFKAFSSHHSLTLSTILTTMLTLLIMPVNIIYLTRLYYYYRYFEGHRPINRTDIYYSQIGKLEKKLSSVMQKITHTKLIYLLLAMTYIGLSLYIGFKATDNLVFAKWNVVISAHRGDTSEAPENSLPSVISAIEKGYDSVEIDVQMTQDGQVVLFHDLTLERMSGVPLKVSDVTFEQLSQYPIGYDINMEPLFIPTLTQVLAASQDQIKLLIDLKPYGQGEKLVEEVIRQVLAFEMENDVYIQSFDQSALRYARMLSTDIKLGQTLFFALGDLKGLDVDFYTIEQSMLTEEFVKKAHSVGREVWVWTVNTKKSLKEVIKYEVDGIITDYPDLAQSMIELDI